MHELRRERTREAAIVEAELAFVEKVSLVIAQSRQLAQFNRKCTTQLSIALCVDINQLRQPPHLCGECSTELVVTDVEDA